MRKAIATKKGSKSGDSDSQTIVGQAPQGFGSVLVIGIVCSFLLSGCQVHLSLPPLPTPTPAGPVIHNLPSEADAALRKFTLRTLETPSDFAFHSEVIPEPPELWLGMLPPDMPFDLPLPVGTEIIGSSTFINQSVGHRIYLDVPQPVADVVDLVRAGFTEQGFQAWTPDTNPFQSNRRFIIFCHPEELIQITFHASAGPDEPTKVQVSYVTHPVYISDCNYPQLISTEQAQALLPQLTMPPGSAVLSGGEGGSRRGDAHARRSFVSDLSLTELAAHLHPQFEAVGWQMVAETQTGPVAWSRWTLQDETSGQWDGVLLITQGPGATGSYLAQIQIERALESMR